MVLFMTFMHFYFREQKRVFFYIVIDVVEVMGRTLTFPSLLQTGSHQRSINIDIEFSVYYSVHNWLTYYLTKHHIQLFDVKEPKYYSCIFSLSIEIKSLEVVLKCVCLFLCLYLYLASYPFVSFLSKYMFVFYWLCLYGWCLVIYVYLCRVTVDRKRRTKDARHDHPRW